MQNDWQPNIKTENRKNKVVELFFKKKKKKNQKEGVEHSNKGHRIDITV